MVEKITRQGKTFYLYTEEEHCKSKKAIAYTDYIQKELDKYDNQRKMGRP